MAYQMTWLLEGRVLDVRLWDTVTALEFRAYNAEIAAHQTRATGRLHLIVDISGLKAYPVTAPEAARIITVSEHPQRGWTVIYGPHSPVFRAFMALVTRLRAFPYRFVDTFDEAWAFLASEDRDLPATPPGGPHSI